MSEEKSVVRIDSAEINQKIDGVVSEVWRQYREMRRLENEKCRKEPLAYVPTTWQVLTRGLGVAAGIGLYRWIGGKK